MWKFSPEYAHQALGSGRGPRGMGDTMFSLTNDCHSEDEMMRVPDKVGGGVRSLGSVTMCLTFRSVPISEVWHSGKRF